MNKRKREKSIGRRVLFVALWALGVILISFIIVSILAIRFANKYTIRKEDSVRSDLNNIRALTEIYFDTHGDSYYISEDDNVCTSNQGFNANYRLANKIEENGGCFASEDSWIAWAKQEQGKDKAWCVDSKGSSREINIVPRPILNENVSCESFAVSD